MNIIKINKDNITEIVCFILFIILAVFISFFHEPWFDEFQAWGISKDSIYNILFKIPHYEGHPPLWHLILKCFSSFNIHPEISLKIPNLIFMFSAVWLLIFKSPFYRIIRVTLPFTYFIFYQYTVISRPYSVFCFALFLAAYYYKGKNEHPYKYIFALILLSLSCAYGMVLATGITIVWGIEILSKEKMTFLKNILKDNRFKAALILVFACAITTLMIYRYPDAYTDYSKIYLIKILYMIFGLPCDALITEIECRKINDISSFNCLYCFLAIFIYIILFSILRYYKTLLLFVIPYSMFLTIASFYIYEHHIGLLTLFFIFVFWCTFASKEKSMEKKYKKLISVLVAIPILIQMYWGICAYINEIKYDYSYSRSFSDYIKEHNLRKYNILAGWKIFNNKSYYNIQIMPVSVLPYFDNKNIFYNFNMINQNQEYVLLRKLTNKENEFILSEIDDKGFPDIIVGDAKLLFSFIEPNNKNDVRYGLLDIIERRQIYKSKKSLVTIPIYAREDVYYKINAK